MINTSTHSEWFTDVLGQPVGIEVIGANRPTIAKLITLLSTAKGSNTLTDYLMDAHRRGRMLASLAYDRTGRPWPHTDTLASFIATRDGGLKAIACFRDAMFMNYQLPPDVATNLETVVAHVARAISGAFSQ